MAFLKRYPIFVAILVICVLAFATEAFFLNYFRKNADAEQEKLESARNTLNATLALQPAPTADNQDLAQRNVTELKSDLDEILATFQKTPVQIPPGPADPQSLLLDIQGYVDRMFALAKEKNVLTPPQKSFGFGMRQYLNNAFPPPKEKARAVFKQMFILQYLLQHLFEARRPAGEWMLLRSVLRENVENTKPNDPGADLQGLETFVEDRLISYRTKDTIDTLAFRIEYVSRSESLRQLLNVLKQFDLPLVVRSIDVKPPAAEDLRELAKTNPPSKDEVGREPVISDNYSQFTIVVEYIELILPDKTPPPAENAPAAGAANGTVDSTNGTVTPANGTTTEPSANGTATETPAS